METASLSEIKNQLKAITQIELQELCLRLAKYKKENKELLNYLLFEADNELFFIQNVKNEIDEQFKQLNRNYLYLAKKTLRKSLNTTNKYIKFSGSKKVEVELLLHFCMKMKSAGLARKSNTAIHNTYIRQTIRINKALLALHEDLQYDYQEAVENL